MEKVFLELFRDIIERDAPIAPEEVLREMEGWDSLAALSMVSMVDDEYGVTISSEALENMITIQNIIDFIKTEMARKRL